MDSGIATVIVGALALVGTLVGSWSGIRQSNKMVNYRINQLEEKVDKHNCLVERMVIVEQSTRSAHHRIDRLDKELDTR